MATIACASSCMYLFQDWSTAIPLYKQFGYLYDTSGLVAKVESNGNSSNSSNGPRQLIGYQANLYL